MKQVKPKAQREVMPARYQRGSGYSLTLRAESEVPVQAIIVVGRRRDTYVVEPGQTIWVGGGVHR